MPQIGLKTTSLSSIQSQIRKMQNETDNAEKKVLSAISGLDFEISSKQNISSCLNNIKKSLVKQSELAGQYHTAFINATDLLADTDGKFASETKGILDRIKSYAEETINTVKDFFVRNRLAKIAAISGLFIATPSVASWAITVETLKGIANWVKNWNGSNSKVIDESEIVIPIATKETDNSESVVRDDNDNGDCSSDTSQNVKQSETISTSVKPYSGSSKDMNPGAYSNYTVINGFDEKYVLNQYDYDLQQSDGSNGGCTSTSDAMVGAFKDNQYYNPEDDWPGPGKGGANWTHTKAIEGSNNWSTSRRYTEMYNQINQGNAVVIRVSGHSMVAIGVQNGCDSNNMSANDILIANPGTGKISTLQEYLNKSGRKIDNSWSLRIAK